jgi:hypothetical protein
MGQAREVMDRLNKAMEVKDKETLARSYATDAVAYTPDQGELRVRDAITSYLFEFWESMPDVRYDQTGRHESGNVAIDEGIIIGTNTGPLRLPSGETLQPTGRELRVHSCDVATVENGEITSHHFYFDQVEFRSQLELMREMTSH